MTQPSTRLGPVNPLVDALHKCRFVFIITFTIAFGINVLSLITSIYALQVLDRVLNSGNLKTLTMLSLIIFGIYTAYTLLQVARSFTLIKIGEWLDKNISPQLFVHAVSSSAIRPSLGASQSIRELGNLKIFLTSIGINSLFDAPWSILYIAVLFAIHPYMGWLAVFGAVLMLCMGFLNAYAVDSNLAQSNEHSIKSHYMADLATRNAETVQALGMMGKIKQRWAALNDSSLQAQSVASYRNGVISNITRLFRSVLQMAVTGVGAYLVVSSHGQDLTSGYMIASSIIIGKALAPFDQAIDTWKQASSALKSYKKIKTSFDQEAARPSGMSIPNPIGKVTAENVFFAPPPSGPGEQPKYTLRGLNFTLEPGKSLAIIGPSAAGKSTLARLLVGVWKPTSGHVRLDSMDVFTWDKEDLGKHIGYLPQGIELFSGSIKDNISRMDMDPDPAHIVEAATLAGVHEMIARLPNGYETDIGIAGSALSGGQRQRVGLARAFYGRPKLVVLDEPNANLDEQGEKGLVDAISNARNQGISTILISHRPSILAFVDMIMILQEGMIAAYGPKDEIMARFAQAAKEQADKAKQSQA